MHQSLPPAASNPIDLIRAVGTARVAVPEEGRPHHPMLRALAVGYADALDLPGPYVLTGQSALHMWRQTFGHDQVITTTDQAPDQRAVIVLDLSELATHDPAPIVDLARRHWALVFETTGT